MNKAKCVKISLLLTALSLSIIIPAIVVTAKKQVYTRNTSVYINDAVEGKGWMDWSAEPWLKGSGTEEDPYMIKDLVIEVSETQFAMMIQDSDAYFKIMKCTFSNGGIEGESAGLLLVNTTNGVIFKNQFIDNKGAGIALLATINNTIQKNLCSGNGVGIYIRWGMYTTIKQNDCKNNFDSGIVIASAHKNIIEKNDCVENGKAGIALINVDLPVNSPKDNIIYANNLENNQLGIYLNDADINDILRNTIAENTFGILFDSGSQGNTVYHNNFIDNGIQAFDQPSMNNWHHPYMEEGNYWSDISYASDEYPFVEKDGWEYFTPIEEEIINAKLDPEANKLGFGREFQSDKKGYLIPGVMQLFSERMEGLAFPPYTIQVVFGVEEVIILSDTVWYFDEEGQMFGEPGLVQIFYLVIPEYYFTDLPLGYYEFQLEFTWYDNGEKIYFNYPTSFYLV